MIIVSRLPILRSVIHHMIGEGYMALKKTVFKFEIMERFKPVGNRPLIFLSLQENFHGQSATIRLLGQRRASQNQSERDDSERHMRERR